MFKSIVTIGGNVFNADWSSVSGQVFLISLSESEETVHVATHGASILTRVGPAALVYSIVQLGVLDLVQIEQLFELVGQVLDEGDCLRIGHTLHVLVYHLLGCVVHAAPTKVNLRHRHIRVVIIVLSRFSETSQVIAPDPTVLNTVHYATLIHARLHLILLGERVKVI